eukprot:COSAG02_NODE_7825_length_2832_cov_1.204903_3_plen_183_part_00
MSHDVYVLSRQMWNSGHPANYDQNRSWSEPWGGSFSNCHCGGHGWPPHGQASCEGLSNTTCDDENIAKWTLGRLERAANGTLDPSGKPFFVAAGFRAADLLCRIVCSPCESNSAQVYVWCLRMGVYCTQTNLIFRFTHRKNFTSCTRTLHCRCPSYLRRVRPHSILARICTFSDIEMRCMFA